MKIEGEISEGRTPKPCHAIKKPKHGPNSPTLGILLLFVLIIGLPPSGWCNTLQSASSDFGDNGFIETMMLRQDLRMMAQAKGQNEEAQENSSKNGDSTEKNPFEEVDSKTGRSDDVQMRFPGAKTKTEPQDMLERTGGMPLEVPSELDLGRSPRMRAILRRQQLLNRFNPAIGFVFEPVFSYKQRVQ
ncbi:MAG: hypothetical protein R3351_02860, partial [Nitrospirales bacterium]|nr:hypothetical protein [Nitrospirales bacterium]